MHTIFVKSALATRATIKVYRTLEDVFGVRIYGRYYYKDVSHSVQQLGLKVYKIMRVPSLQANIAPIIIPDRPVGKKAKQGLVIDTNILYPLQDGVNLVIAYIEGFNAKYIKYRRAPKVASSIKVSMQSANDDTVIVILRDTTDAPIDVDNYIGDIIYPFKY